MGYVSSIVLRRPLAPPLLALSLALSCKPAGEERTTSAAEIVEPSPVDTAAPDDDDVWRDLNDGGGGARVDLCSAGSPELEDARARFDALDAVAEGLADADPVGPFNGLASALYDHACMAVARADEPALDLKMTTAIEARTYWRAGLGLWLKSYLDLAEGTEQTVWLLPSRPELVTEKTRPGDPLAPWMCPADPESPCVRAVAAWRARADRYFELWKHPGGIQIVDCAPAVENGPAEDAYGRWRACEDGGLRRHAALPLGGLGPIEEGWVVVYGRRGHYQYCDEVAALDLLSGSHYRFAECDHRPELDGLADAGASERASEAVEVRARTLAPELLREFAWAAMSAPYVRADVISERSLGRDLPAGVKVSRRETLSASGMGLSGSSSSGHTTLAWIWTRGAAEIPAHGELSWPSGLSSPAEDHAVRLLAIAELRPIAGCAAVDLPAWIVDNLGEGRAPASEHGLVDPPSAAVLGAMRRQVKRGRCVR